MSSYHAHWVEESHKTKLCLPGTAMTLSPTLLCSRSLHSSRATIQDHHRDHRGGAVGALLLLFRWVGDQLHSKGNTCQTATQPYVASLTFLWETGQQVTHSHLPIFKPQKYQGHSVDIWVIKCIFTRGVRSNESDASLRTLALDNGRQGKPLLLFW